MGNFTSQLVSGGADENVLSSLRSYSTSSASAAKARFVDMVIAAFGKFGMSLEGNTPDAKFNHAIKQIENLKVAAKTNEQKAVLVNLAKATNTISGSSIINVEAEPAEIARQLSELFNSITHAMHLEFLQIHNDAKSLLTNLKFIENIQRENVEQIKKEIKASTDPALSGKLNRQMELAELVINESGRQIVMLANIISSTLDPDAAKMADLIRSVSKTSNQDIQSYVSGDKTGFALLVKNMLIGFGTTAQFADYIRTRLEKIGMTLSEYSAKNAMDILNRKLSEAVLAAGSDDKRLEELINVTNTLRENIGNGAEISRMGGGHPFLGGADGGAEAYGLAIDAVQDDITTADKRIERQKAVRNIILGAFARRLQDLFRNFMTSLFTMAEKIGNEIVVDDNIRSIAENVARFGDVFTPTLNNASIYYSLIGVYRDAMSLQRRDTAMGEINTLRGKLDAITVAAKPGAEYFAAISTHLKAMQDLINQYSTEIKTKFTGGNECIGLDDRPVREQMGEIEGGCDSCDSDGERLNLAMGGAGCPFETYAGGADFEGGADAHSDNHFLPRTFYVGEMTITKALEKFRTNMNAALIRSNIRHLTPEIRQYGDNYSELLETSIAEKMINVATRAKEAKTRLETLRTAATPMSPEEFTAAERVIDRIAEVAKRFWAAVETVEKYLVAFTIDATNSENLAQDIQSMLDSAIGTEDWYRPESGDILAGVFEHFPSFVKGTGDKENTTAAYADAPNFVDAHIMPNPEFSQTGGEHYYAKLAADAAIVKELGLGGNPGNPTMPTQGDEAIGAAGNVFKHMMVVKWLLAVFTSIAMKSEKKIITDMTMTPAKLRLVLEEFIQVSSFAIGYGNATKHHVSSDSSVTITSNYTTASSVTGSGIDFTIDPTSQRQARLLAAGVWMPGVDSNKYVGFNMFSLEDEQQYFVMIMKSIAAKVMVMLGRAKLLEETGQKRGITPLRMILGGALETPKVMDGAAELYLRLPLLMQFYHEIFGMDRNDLADYTGTVGTINVKIGLMPDVGGPFSNLIRICFRKPDVTSFSDEEIKDLVREVNTIYNTTITGGVAPAEATRHVITQVVDEINRRYGVVSLQNLQKIEDQRIDEFQTNPYGDSALESDTPVLFGEEDTDFDRPSGAEKLINMRTVGVNSYLANMDTKRKTAKIQESHQTMLTAFRTSIDKFFEGENSTGSFRPNIAALRSKLKREAGEEERIRTLATFLRGINVTSHFDSVKMLMFHETVITGLSTLSAIHTILARFKYTILATDLKTLERLLFHEIDSTKMAGKSWAAIVGSISQTFATNHIVPDRDVAVETIINTVFGSTLGQRYNDPTNEVVLEDGTTESHLAITRRLAPYTESDLLKHAKGNASASTAATNVHAYLRAIFDREAVMKILLETISGISSDLQGVVNFTVNDGRLQLRFGDLASSIEEMFASVQYFMNIFRSHLSREVIDKYTGKMNAGSLYWLHEQLVEKILRGRKTSEVSGAKARIAYANLDDLSTIASKTFEDLNRQWRAVTPSAGIAATLTEPQRISYARVFSEYIFYDGALPNSGVKSGKGVSVIEYKSNPFEELHVSFDHGVKTIDLRYISRFTNLYSWDQTPAEKQSLMFSFNDLLAKFIYSFYDTSSQRIYGGLVNTFANSTFSKNVQDVKFTYPDTRPCIMLNAETSTKDVLAPDRHLYSKLDPTMRDTYRVMEPVMLRLMRIAPNYGVTDQLFRDNYMRNYLDYGVLVELLPENDGIFAGYTRDQAAGIYLQWALDNTIALPPAFVLTPDQLNAQFVNINWRHNTAAIMTAIKDYDYGSKSIVDREEIVKFYARLFAGLLSVSFKLGPGLPLQTFIKNYKETLDKKLYIPPVAQMTDYMVKYDTLDSNFSNKAEMDYMFSSIGKGHVIAARHQSINNAFEAGTIFKLGVDKPADLNVADLEAWDNIVDTQFSSRADPDGDHVLFSSLAVIFSTLTKSMASNNSLTHITDNVADIPVYMKEKMRANLPGFKNLFNTLIRRCEFIKSLMSRSPVHLERTWRNMRGLVSSTFHNPWPWSLKQPVGDNSETRYRFGDITDAIIRGCQSMVQGCDNVLRELGGDAKFLELSQGFNRDYKAVNNAEPFAPLSTLCAIFRNDRKAATEFLPFHSMGDTGYKFAYGTRSIYGNLLNPITQTHLTGFNQIIDNFNVSADTTLDKSQIESFSRNAVKLMRFVYETKHLRGLFAIDKRTFTRGDLVATDTVIVNDGLVATRRPNPNTSSYEEAVNYVPTNASAVSMLAKGVDGNEWVVPAYSARTGLSDTVRIIETISRDEKIKEMLGPILGKQRHQNDQFSAALQNIIDLNIMPINIHALMRGIPLVNLYNYSYTFDHFVDEIFTGQKKTSNLFYQLLISPHSVVSDRTDKFDEKLHDLMTGRIFPGDMGRPRFLSDQVYNKSLFRELYRDGALLAMGPAAESDRYTPDAMWEQLMRSLIAGSAKFNRTDADDIIQDLRMKKAVTAIATDITPRSAIEFIHAMSQVVYSIVKSSMKYNSTDEKAYTLQAIWTLMGRMVDSLNSANPAAAFQQTLNRNPIDLSSYAGSFTAGYKYTAITGRDMVIKSSNAGMPAHTKNRMNYIKRSTDKVELASVEIPHLVKFFLSRLGTDRFDTYFMRNITFSVLLLRILRYKLRKDAESTRDVIRHGFKSTVSRTTESFGNE